mmetsp:Transcript_25743/g.60177  ORF Transcript_25743/g.60177 Transcript_25743/m.60177 type:complete len:226 (-) Transcript_25743:1278-1955(-)
MGRGGQRAAPGATGEWLRRRSRRAPRRQARPPPQLLRPVQRRHGRGDVLVRQAGRGGRLLLQSQHPPAEGVRDSQGGEQTVLREAGHRIRGLRLRFRELVRPDEGDGIRSRAREAMHGVLRYADGTDGAVRAREWVRCHRHDECHEPVEGCQAGRWERLQSSRKISRPALLVQGLAERRDDVAQVRDIGQGALLQAGVLRLLLLPARFQRLAQGQRHSEDCNRWR